MNEARIEQALTVGPGFSEAESRLLWRAPLARESLFLIREKLRGDVLTRWREIGIEPVARFRAAADQADEVIKVHGEGFSLTIFPKSDQAMPWILSLQVDALVREGLPSGIRLRLVDSSR